MKKKKRHQSPDPEPTDRRSWASRTSGLFDPVLDEAIASYFPLKPKNQNPKPRRKKKEQQGRWQTKKRKDGGSNPDPEKTVPSSQQSTTSSSSSSWFSSSLGTHWSWKSILFNSLNSCSKLKKNWLGLFMFILFTY